MAAIDVTPGADGRFLWRVFVVDPRMLFGDFLIGGLAPLDPTSRYTWLFNAEEFLKQHVKGSKAVVLLYRGGSDLVARNSFQDDVAKLRAFDHEVRAVLIADNQDPRQVLDALEAGAHGYVPMSLPLKVVVEALRLVKAGGVFVPASSMQELATSAAAEAVRAPADLMGFSPRQLSVARALRKGTPNKIIAYELNMCESTVKVHVRQIMKKLKARNRTEIAYLTSAIFAAEPPTLTLGLRRSS